MENFTVTEKTTSEGVKIVVVGVGGGGSNMIENLLGSDISKLLIILIYHINFKLVKKLLEVKVQE